MSITKCLLGKVSQGKLTKAQAEELVDNLKYFEDKNKKNMSAPDAATLAAKEMYDTLKRQNERNKYLIAKQFRMQEHIKTTMDSHAWGQGFGGLALLDIDMAGRNDIQNLSTRRSEIRGVAYSKMTDVLAKFRSRIPGTFHNNDYEDMLLKAVFKETNDAAAQNMAQAWWGAADYLRARANAAGSAIPENENWGIPFRHSKIKYQDMFRQARKEVKASGRKLTKKQLIDEADKLAGKKFAEAMLPLLNRKLVKSFYSEKPFTDEELQKILTRMFRNLRTGGLYEAKPGAHGSKKLAKKRDAFTFRKKGSGLDAELVKEANFARFLYFKDSASYKTASRMFGEGDAYETMLMHIEEMALETAQLEILGPNPRAMIDFMKDHARKENVVGGEDKLDLVKPVYEHIETLYDTITGRSAVPVRPNVTDGFKAVPFAYRQRSKRVAQIVNSEILDIGLFNQIAPT